LKLHAYQTSGDKVLLICNKIITEVSMTHSRT